MSRWEVGVGFTVEAASNEEAEELVRAAMRRRRIPARWGIAMDYVQPAEDPGQAEGRPHAG